MDISNIRLQYKSIVENVLERKLDDEGFDGFDLQALEIDSVTFIKLLVELETQFDVEFGKEIFAVQGSTRMIDLVNMLVRIM